VRETESERSGAVREGVSFAEAMSSRPARSASEEKLISCDIGTKRQLSTALSGDIPTWVEAYVFMVRGVSGSVERVRWTQGWGNVPPSPVW
jgi:hypothetical protein